MKSAIRSIALGAALCFAAASLTPSFAQAPAAAPAGTTGLCKDGSYTSSATRRGSCRGHQGVQQWYAADSGAAPSAAQAAPTPAAAAAPVAPAGAAPAAPVAPVAPAATAAPGGGPGLVWVNSSSNVYHCPGDKWYGKTKHGEYLSEADAKSKGARPDHGKACTT